MIAALRRMGGKRIAIVASAVFSFVFAWLSYQYLALMLFRIGLSDFYNIAPQVPEICNAVVSDAAVAFSGLYDYVGIGVALAFVVLGAYLSWRSYAQANSHI